MKVLVINSGSSSLKYQLINTSDEAVLAKGLCDRIGLDQSYLKHTTIGKDTVVIEKDIHDHTIATQYVLDMLTDNKNGVISDIKEISAVGHRVVHGGEKFHNSVLIDKDVKKTIEECIELAPLHNPPNLVGIEACEHIMNDVPMVAVFDTAFHQTLPKYSYLYALPYNLYEKHGIRKYGFHGTSHKYVAQRAANILDKPIDKSNLIVCHLGNGSSICAVKNGKSIETSMGFTPLDGLAMGTRSGSIDPAVIKFLMEKEEMTIGEVDQLLNKKSGVLGISGISSDFRDLQEASENGNELADLALDIFCYRVKKYIGEYAAIIGSVDAVIMTAGIGENNCLVRERSLTGLEALGIEIDLEKNKIRGEEKDISTKNSKIKIFIIPTNEELAIARETIKLI
ncbi:MAG: acetate kinase [Clostridiales bacterium]